VIKVVLILNLILLLNDNLYASRTGKHNFKLGKQSTLVAYSVSNDYPYVAEIYPKHGRAAEMTCKEGEPQSTGTDDIGNW